MAKNKRFRAFRKLLIGWVTHAIHERDRTERVFHLACEVLLFLVILSGLSVLKFVVVSMWGEVFIIFIVTHSLWWIINGNFHVNLLECFKFVHNSGVDEVVKFVSWMSNLIIKTKAVDAVLIYGSFCRSKFHSRSDLDIRIIRRPHVKGTIKLFILTVFARIVSFYRRVPLDLQVVDSYKFLDSNMKRDDFPVVVFRRDGFKIDKVGILFTAIIENPSLVLSGNT